MAAITMLLVRSFLLDEERERSQILRDSAIRISGIRVSKAFRDFCKESLGNSLI